MGVAAGEVEETFVGYIVGVGGSRTGAVVSNGLVGIVTTADFAYTVTVVLISLSGAIVSCLSVYREQATPQSKISASKHSWSPLLNISYRRMDRESRVLTD